MEIDQSLRRRAKALGLRVTPYRKKKAVIREIQVKEGGEPCFWTDLRDQCEGKCEWASECQKNLVAVWMR